MTQVAETSPVTDGVLAALRTGTGLLIGDAEKPVNHNNDPATIFPYAIVYVGTVSLTGSLADPKEDGVHRVQVTCVGRIRETAEMLRDRCRSILLNLADPIDIDGHAVAWTDLVTDPPTFREDEQGKPSTFTAITVVNLCVTPVPTGS